MKVLKSGIILSAAIALGLALAGCAGSDGSGSDDSKTVRIATGIDASYAPVYVAAEKGLFKKHGVNVEYVTTEGGPAAGQAVIADTADIATLSDGTSVTLMGQAPDLQAFSVMEESSEYIKTVLRKGIDSPSDIKTMGTVPGIITMAAERYLESAGVDPESVEMISQTPPDIPPLMERGDIDATVIYEPFAGRAAKAGGEIIGDIGDFGMKYQQWLLANKAWLEENGDSAAKVTKALDEASNLINQSPEDAAKITEKAVQVPSKLTVSLLPQISFEQRDLNNDDLKQSTDTASFFVESGEMKSVPDLDEQIIVGWSNNR